MIRPPSSALLALVLMVLVTAGAGACAVSQGSVTFLGTEDDQFRALREEFTRETGIKVIYQATRAQDQVLPVDVQNDTQPDVAALSGIGELAWYESQGYLRPLDDVIDDSVWAEYSPQWRQLAQAGLNEFYAVPIQVNLKSMVWYNTNGPPPDSRTLEELVRLRPPAESGSTWCMGMGSTATSGWPGTDWIEDLLLQRFGAAVYQLWVAGVLEWDAPEVREAWETWGGIVTGSGQVYGGSKTALLTDFADAARPMFTDPPDCVLEHQASFMSGFYQNYESKPDPETDFDFVEFPRLDGAPPDAPGMSREVAADMVVMFNDTPQARKLIRFLASKGAQQKLAEAGAFSANTQVPSTAYPHAVGRRIAGALTGSDTLCFDASDAMPATMRNAFYRAVLEYLNDPGQLDALLGNLDNIRERLPEERWLAVSCGQEQ